VERVLLRARRAGFRLVLPRQAHQLAHVAAGAEGVLACRSNDDAIVGRLARKPRIEPSKLLAHGNVERVERARTVERDKRERARLFDRELFGSLCRPRIVDDVVLQKRVPREAGWGRQATMNWTNLELYTGWPADQITRAIRPEIGRLWTRAKPITE